MNPGPNIESMTADEEIMTCIWLPNRPEVHTHSLTREIMLVTGYSFDTTHI